VLSTYRFVYTAHIVPSVSITLCEVGLLLEVDVDMTSSISRTRLLVARDNIGPVTAPAGSTITVTYTIEMPYNTAGGFNMNFYHVVGNYLLGLKGTNGTTLPIYTHNNQRVDIIDLGAPGAYILVLGLNVGDAIRVGGNAFTIVTFIPNFLVASVGASSTITYTNVRISVATVGGLYIVLSGTNVNTRIPVASLSPTVTPGIYQYLNYNLLCRYITTYTTTTTVTETWNTVYTYTNTYTYTLTPTITICNILIFYAPHTTNIGTRIPYPVGTGTIVVEILYRSG